MCFEGFFYEFCFNLVLIEVTVVLLSEDQRSENSRFV